MIAMSPGDIRECTCSRCQRPIVCGIAIRLWRDGREWRYHPACLGFVSQDRPRTTIDH